MSFSLADWTLSFIIDVAQKTPLRARGGYSSIAIERQKTATGLDKARAEANDWQRLFRFFPHYDVQHAIEGKTILDFGSGFGGRTVEYVRRCGAAQAYGTEVGTPQVEAGRAFAAEVGLSDRVKFDLTDQDRLPYPAGTFDAVVTFDVLEHVADPRVSLGEIQRVLKPGGRLYAVFPPYRGAFSHHLDYLTLWPALHLMFSPERIMRVVNKQLDKRPEIIVRRHFELSHHFKTGIPILPMLNGMGLKDFRKAVENWKVISLRRNSVLDVAASGSMVANIVRPLTAFEPLTFNIAAILDA